MTTTTKCRQVRGQGEEPGPDGAAARLSTSSASPSPSHLIPIACRWCEGRSPPAAAAPHGSFRSVGPRVRTRGREYRPAAPSDDLHPRRRIHHRQRKGSTDDLCGHVRYLNPTNIIKYAAQYSATLQTLCTRRQYGCRICGLSASSRASVSSSNWFRLNLALNDQELIFIIPQEDCFSVLMWVARRGDGHPALKNVDLTRVITAGDSAGGNLAAGKGILTALLFLKI